jgi:hypothetical protein
MRRFYALASFVAEISFGGAALAQMAMPMPGVAAAPACGASSDASLPPVLAAWNSRTPLAAAASTAGLRPATLTIGRGVDAQLKRSSEVTFPVAPGRPGPATTYSGLFALQITEPGDYQVSLGSSAWIELAHDGTMVAPNAHASGPPCATLRKTVVFPLKPGAYVLEIAGNAEPVLGVLVTHHAPPALR